MPRCARTVFPGRSSLLPVRLTCPAVRRVHALARADGLRAVRGRTLCQRPGRVVWPACRSETTKCEVNERPFTCVPSAHCAARSAGARDARFPCRQRQSWSPRVIAAARAAPPSNPSHVAADAAPCLATAGGALIQAFQCQPHAGAARTRDWLAGSRAGAHDRVTVRYR